MVKAKWRGAVLAESGATVVVEGNHYFPRDSVHWQYFQESDHRTVCPWKGTASYYDVIVDGEVNESAAWYYPDPEEEAREVSGRVAFWHGVKVEVG